jgi:hypothetical protein
MVEESTPLNIVEKNITTIRNISKGAVNFPNIIDNLSGLKAIKTDSVKNKIEYKIINN